MLRENGETKEREFYLFESDEEIVVSFEELRKEGDTIKLFMEICPKKHDVRFSMNLANTDNDEWGRMERCIPYAYPYKRDRGSYVTVYENPGVVKGTQTKHVGKLPPGQKVPLGINNIKRKYVDAPGFISKAQWCINDFVENAGGTPLDYIHKFAGHLHSLFAEFNGSGYCEDMCSLVEAAADNFSDDHDKPLYARGLSVNCSPVPLSKRKGMLESGKELDYNHEIVEVTYDGKSLIVDPYTDRYECVFPGGGFVMDPRVKCIVFELFDSETA